jgi:hypothetical protein
MVHLNQKIRLMSIACCPFLHTCKIKLSGCSDLVPIAAATAASKEVKFQPYAPFAHTSLDAFPLVQVNKLSKIHGIYSRSFGTLFMSLIVYAGCVAGRRVLFCA